MFLENPQNRAFLPSLGQKIVSFSKIFTIVTFGYL